MLPIRQCLMSKRGGIDAVRKIYSHTQSLGQCQHWLSRHLPNAEQVGRLGHAEAARLAAKEHRTAAIASRAAASSMGSSFCAKNIGDESKNTTRFLVLGSNDAAPSGKDKTSLILATRNTPGAIHELLTPLPQMASA